MKIEIAHQDVAARAFCLFQAAGCPDGQDTAHWLEAEEQLKNEMRENIKDDRTLAETIPGVEQMTPANSF